MAALFGKSFVQTTVNKNLKTKKFQLDAFLASISNEGIATIAFNKDVYEIKNLSAIDSDFLSIKIAAGKDSDP